MRAAALLMGVLMLTAGCIGMGGDDSETSANGGTVDANTSSTPATQDANHSHDPAPEPHWDNRTGEISGTNAVFLSNGIGNETIEIPDTSKTFEVTLTAEDGELDGELYPPECEEDDNTHGEDCSHSIDTFNGTQGQTAKDGGTATFSTEDPDAGNWTLRLFKSDPGNNDVPYTITFFYVDAHQPAADHHS